MADSVTIAKAIIEVGATGADDAKDEIQTLEIKLQRLDQSYKQGNITLTAYASKTQHIKNEIAALKGGIDAATTALQKHGTAQAAIASLDARSTGGMRNTQMGFLELSRAFEDAQFGLRGVLNNIPTTIQMFGGPAGLAAGVSAVAVAFSIALPYIQKFVDGLGILEKETESIKGPIDELKTRIEKLEAKPIKLEVDYNEIEQATKELKRLEEAKRAFDAAGKGRDPYEKKAGEAAQEAFNLPEGRGDEIKEKLKAQVFGEMKTEDLSQFQNDVQAAEGAMARAFDAGSRRLAGDQLARAKKRLDDARKNKGDANTANKQRAEIEVGKLFQGINEGNDPKVRAEMARRLRLMGEENLARSVELASPEELLKQDQIDDKFDESQGRNDAGKAKRKIAKDQVEGIDEDNRRAFDDWKKLQVAAQEKENSRLAGAMQNSVGQSYLRTPGMDDAALQDQVKTAMTKAGMKSSEVDAAAEGVAKKIREKLDEAVQVRSLDKGISVDAARAELAKEAQAKDDKQANLPKSEVMSTGSYLSKVLVAGLSKSSENVPKDQLVEAKKTNDILGNVLKEVAKPQKSIPATVGPGR